MHGDESLRMKVREVISEVEGGSWSGELRVALPETGGGSRRRTAAMVEGWWPHRREKCELFKEKKYTNYFGIDLQSMLAFCIYIS